MYQKIKNKLSTIKQQSNKSSIYIYCLLRALVTTCMILEFIRGDLNNAFLCLLSLILFFIPIFIKRKFKIELPNTLEIIILLFIFSAEILGEINNFYNIIPYWDTVLHTINGFLAAGVGFSLIDLLNKNITSIKLSPLFVAIVSFCFSMTIGVLWEFYEYISDNSLLHTDMQKDRIVTNINTMLLDKKNTPLKINNIEYTIIYSVENDKIVQTIIPGGYLDIGLNDTMKDLFVNFIGALCFSTFGYFYISNKEKFKFLSHFILKRQELPE